MRTGQTWVALGSTLLSNKPFRLMAESLERLLVFGFWRGRQDVAEARLSASLNK